MIGENQQLPPMPILLLLSHEGLLSLFWVLNLLPGAATICAPPAPLQDTTGLHLFVSQVSQEVSCHSNHNPTPYYCKVIRELFIGEHFILGYC